MVRRTVVDHLLTAAQDAGRGQITNAEVAAYLAQVNPAYVRQLRESEANWLVRVGKQLKAELTDLGVDLAPARLTEADGTRPNGYTTEAIKAAVRKLDGD
ncbi:hypothetical protein ACFQZC_25435 [Streptacidiphilus monticola]